MVNSRCPRISRTSFVVLARPSAVNAGGKEPPRGRDVIRNLLHLSLIEVCVERRDGALTVGRVPDRSGDLGTERARRHRERPVLHHTQCASRRAHRPRAKRE